MRFKCRFLKKKFLLLLITLGIGSALYANDELKSLADSLRRMIDEKPLFIQQKEQRINRIKCLLKGSGLTLEQKYKINFQLCNEYKKFVVDSAIHYVVFLCPLILLFLLASPDTGHILSFGILILGGALLLLYLKESLMLFLSKKISILHWFLYLCAVEIFPVSFVWLSLTRI